MFSVWFEEHMANTFIVEPIWLQYHCDLANSFMGSFSVGLLGKERDIFAVVFSCRDVTNPFLRLCELSCAFHCVSSVSLCRTVWWAFIQRRINGDLQQLQVSEIIYSRSGIMCNKWNKKKCYLEIIDFRFVQSCGNSVWVCLLVAARVLQVQRGTRVSLLFAPSWICYDIVFFRYAITVTSLIIIGGWFFAGIWLAWWKVHVVTAFFLCQCVFRWSFYSVLMVNTQDVVSSSIN